MWRMRTDGDLPQEGLASFGDTVIHDAAKAGLKRRSAWKSCKRRWPFQVVVIRGPSSGGLGLRAPFGAPQLPNRFENGWLCDQVSSH